MEQNKNSNALCPKSEDGKHVWEVSLKSPGHHGEKKMVEVFICKNCLLSKPIKQS